MAKQEKETKSLYSVVENIGETPDYFLYVGVLPAGVGEYEGEHYLIVNKNTEVIEVETRLLPKAYEYLDQLQAALDMRFQPNLEEKEPSIVQYDH